MTNQEKKRNEFYESVIAEFGFTKEEITAILARKFSGFKLSDLDEYRKMLREEKVARNIEDEKRALAQENKPKPIRCPICGDTTIGIVTVVDSRNPANRWRCNSGGFAHYYRARTNKICERLGYAKPYEEDPDAYKDTKKRGTSSG